MTARLRSLLLGTALLFAHASVARAADDPLGDVLADELARTTALLADAPDAPYYVSVAVTDQQFVKIEAEWGTVATDDRTHQRWLDVDLRIGTPELDNTHTLRGMSGLDDDDRGRVALPIEDDPIDATRYAVWSELDRRYRQAAERIVLVRSERSVKVEEERPAPDFSSRPSPGAATIVVPPIEVDTAAWSRVLAQLSQTLSDDPAVTDNTASLSVQRDERTFVDTEGARLSHGTLLARVSLSASAVAPDGDILTVYRSLDAHDPRSLPGADELAGWAVVMKQDLARQLAAPRGEPYRGPVLLSGRAAGVFFHEVFGHRVEGHRQKSEDEGRTFADQVGQQVLAPFLDVYDDPTQSRAYGVDLNGHYHFDDEGSPAQRAELATRGDFVGFLMSRSPIPGFDQTNGHGRRSPGLPPVSRMGNTFVEASTTVPTSSLRGKLLDLVRQQGLPYGYIVEEIEGGFTMTGRVTPNAFNVRATALTRVWADGRPDEPVRGLDLVGTPLVAFRNIVAAGDTPEVFNGFCGAESGWVPVSAVAPPLLVREVEFQIKEKGQERPPILPRPGADADGGQARVDAGTNGGAR